MRYLLCDKNNQFSEKLCVPLYIGGEKKQEQANEPKLQKQKSLAWMWLLLGFMCWRRGFSVAVLRWWDL
jgi:hypothetical protein